METKNSYPLKIYHNPEAVTFYEKDDVFPVSRLRFNKYKDNYIPFLFSKPGEIYSASEKHAVIRKDIISSGFYFLSCWHERVLMDKAEIDNRFDYFRSLQYQGGFVELPVVDVYADILRGIIEIILPEFSRENQWGEHSKFFMTVSHDIDYWNYWTIEHYRHTFKYNFKRLLKNPHNAAYKIIGHALRRIFSHSYPRMRRIVRGEEYRNINATYFLITGELDDKYRLNSKKVVQYENNRHAYFKKMKYRTQIEGLLDEHDVQLHGTPKSSFNAEILKSERETLEELGKPITGYRSHTLSFDYHKSFDVLEKQNIAYDSTVGFWETIGYRCGTSYPFFPFNFKENRPYRILEIPLTVMDTSMMSTSCMNLTPWKAYGKLKTIVRNAEKYGSNLSILWHNTTFEIVDYPFWGYIYWMIIRYVRKRNGMVLSLSELYKIWNAR
jgi:hypothetical protein